MKDIQNAVFGVGMNPKDINGLTEDGTAFDTRAQSGIKYLACIVQIGNIAANATTLKIQHSDNNSDWADVTGGGFTAPTAAGGDNKILVAFLTMGGTMRRYVRVTATAGAAATLASAVWIGLQVNQSPNSATERGVDEQLILSV